MSADLTKMDSSTRVQRYEPVSNDLTKRPEKLVCHEC
jgi:hypothetical protein